MTYIICNIHCSVRIRRVPEQACCIEDSVTTGVSSRSIATACAACCNFFCKVVNRAINSTSRALPTSNDGSQCPYNLSLLVGSKYKKKNTTATATAEGRPRKRQIFRYTHHHAVCFSISSLPSYRLEVPRGPSTCQDSWVSAGPSECAGGQYTACCCSMRVQAGLAAQRLRG